MTFKFYCDDYNGNIVDYARAAIQQGDKISYMSLNGGGIWPADATWSRHHRSPRPQIFRWGLYLQKLAAEVVGAVGNGIGSL